MQTPAGLILGDTPIYLDHLAPFCALQGWPLILCEKAIAERAHRDYPNLKIIETTYWDLSLPSTLVACETKRGLEFTLGKSISHCLWLPHGNSDKGWSFPFFQALQGETALVYGQKMVDFMGEQKVFPPLIRIGNFRLHYWLEHLEFYNQRIQETFSLPKDKKIYLYAPTWEDVENNGSFWPLFPPLTAHLPSDCYLIVKLHPNTIHRYVPELERLMGRYEARQNIFFLSDWTPIYPLLNLCDAYIGDVSSIGYDFLYWNRPMFFLHANRETPPLFLHQCGKRIDPEEIGSIFLEQDDTLFKSIRSNVYEYTFDRSAQYRL